MKINKYFKKISMCITLISLILLSGCFSDPNEKANKLYADIMKNERIMIYKSRSYSDFYEYYKKTQKSIELIISDYAASDIATNILLGKAKILGTTLPGFYKLEEPLLKILEIEKVPFELAIHFSKQLDSNWELVNLAGIYIDAQESEKALILLNSNPEFYADKITYLIENAEELIVTGDEEKAIQLLNIAIQFSHEKLNQKEQIRALSNIAVQLSLLGKDKQSTDLLLTTLNMADSIEIKHRDYFKDLVLSEVMLVNIIQGKVYKAFDGLNEIKGDKEKYRAVNSIAEYYIKIGKNAEAIRAKLKALEILTNVEKSLYEKDDLLYETNELSKDLSKQYSIISDYDKALYFKNKLSEEYLKELVLREIAYQYAMKDQYNEALKVLNQLRDKVQIEHELRQIAVQYFIDGKADKAENILKNLTIQVIRIRGLVEAAYQLSVNGQNTKSLELLSQASEIIDYVPSSININTSLSSMAIIYISLKMDKEAHDMIEKIDNLNVKVTALNRSIREYTKMGKNKKATIMMFKLIDLVDLNNNRHKADIFEAVVNLSISVDLNNNHQEIVKLSELYQLLYPIKYFLKNVEI